MVNLLHYLQLYLEGDNNFGTTQNGKRDYKFGTEGVVGFAITRLELREPIGGTRVKHLERILYFTFYKPKEL